jgi:sulfur-carrier protein
MLINVQLFAGARDRVGRNSIQIELAENSTVQDLRGRLVADYPTLADIVPRAMLAIDAEYAQNDGAIRPASEIALIPPVSGG